MDFCDLLFGRIVDTSEEYISKSSLCIRRCIYFFFCLCNVSQYCFLFIWKANKVKLGNKLYMYLWRIIICVLLNLRNLPECCTMILNRRHAFSLYFISLTSEYYYDQFQCTFSLFCLSYLDLALRIGLAISITILRSISLALPEHTV